MGYLLKQQYINTLQFLSFHRCVTNYTYRWFATNCKAIFLHPAKVFTSCHQLQVTWLVITEAHSSWRPLASVITTLYYVAVLSMGQSLMLQTLYFSLLCVVSHTFSVLCVYSMFGHHSHPRSYLCAKFRFFHDLHCWASPWRKMAYSITHSLTQLIRCPGNQSDSEQHFPVNFSGIYKICHQCYGSSIALIWIQ